MRLAAAALVSLALGVFAAATVHSQEKPAPLQVGFVDVERVLADYRKRGQVLAEIDQKKAEMTQAFKQRRALIEEKRDRLQTLAEGSEDALRLQREIDLDLLTYKRDAEFEDQRMGRLQNQKVGLIYREVCQEIRAHAEQRGLAAVFAYDPLPQGFENKMSTLAVIQNRDVLFADPRLDLTDAVVESLNSQLPPEPAPAPKEGGAPAEGGK